MADGKVQRPHGSNVVANPIAGSPGSGRSSSLAEQRIAGKESAFASDVTLTGWRLDLARLFWIVVTFFNAIAFLAGIPRALQIAADFSPAALERLDSLGVPPWLPVAYLALLDLTTFAIFFAVAIIIFRRQSTERLAIITSLMLSLTGMLYTAPGYEARVPFYVLAAGAALAETMQITFLLTFPTGRFYPRLSWIALPFLFLWRWWIWAAIYIPRFYASARNGDNYPFLEQDGSDLLLFFACVLAALFFQWQRYRSISNRRQRQQAKWLVWAVTISVLMVGGYVLALNLLPIFQSADGGSVLWRLLGRTVRQAALILLPLVMLRAILRDRLWDIDLVINRSLVYVPVTSILAGIFAAVAALSQRFFVTVTGERSDFGILISTVVVTTLFQPIRTEVQSAVDKRMKESPDAFGQLNQFDTQVAGILNVLDKPTLLRRLLEESVYAFDAQGGAVYEIENDKPVLRFATEGWNGPLRIQMRIGDAAHTHGWLALGDRQGDISYQPADRTRLFASVEQVSRLLSLLYALEPLPAQEGAGDAEDRNSAGGVVLPLPVTLIGDTAIYAGADGAQEPATRLDHLA